MDIGSLLNKKDSPSPRSRSPASQAPPSQRPSESQSAQNTPPHFHPPQSRPSLPSAETSTSSGLSPTNPSELSNSTLRGSRLLDISTQALDNISSLRDVDVAMASARSDRPSLNATSTGASYSEAENDPNASREGREVLAKTLKCSGCTKMFARRSDLVRHERIHSGVRPHQCNHPGCDKSFIQRSALTVHERVHSGAKPHECTECGKPFSDSSSLARHRRTHTGLRPYQCDFPGCGKDFTRRTTLTRHKQQHASKGHVPVTTTGGSRLSVSTSSSQRDGDDFERAEQTGGPSPLPEVHGSGSLMYHSFAVDDGHGRKSRRRQSRASQTSSQVGLPPTETNPQQSNDLANQYAVPRQTQEGSRESQPSQYEDPRYHNVRHQVVASPSAAALPHPQQSQQPAYDNRHPPSSHQPAQRQYPTRHEGHATSPTTQAPQTHPSPTVPLAHPSHHPDTRSTSQSSPEYYAQPPIRSIAQPYGNAAGYRWQ